MAITPLPTPPSRAQAPANFSSTADTFVAALPTFVTETNALAVEVDDIRDATAALKVDTQAIKDAAVADTNAIKDAAVADTNAIKAATEVIRDAAGVHASNAEASMVTATTRAAEAASSANFVGAWASLSGALSVPASVLHNGHTWRLLANLPDVTASEPGADEEWTPLIAFQVLAYDDRTGLRTMPEVPKAMAMVDGLGMFVWYAGSDEPDDDESCFATTNGRWLLEAVHWDVVDAWQSPDWDESQSANEDLQSRFLTTTFENAISSVGGNATTSVVIPLNGADVGDAVIVTTNGRHTSCPQGFVFASVESQGVVTVYYSGTYSGGYFKTGTWRVTVIKP